MGAINRDVMDSLIDWEGTDDHRESAFLFQQLSVLIQRYNAYLCPHNPQGRNVAI